VHKNVYLMCRLFFIAENEIDGATLTGLTDNMTSELLPLIQCRVKLVKLLQDSRVVDCGTTKT